MRIVLSGPAYSGKTTLARILAQKGFVHVDYTGYIKRAASKAIFNTTGAEITEEMIEADKKNYRSYLQALCEIAGFNNGAGIEEVLEQNPHWQEAEHVVFDNVRFAQQYQRLIPHKFTLVTLMANEDVRWQRALKAGVNIRDFNESRTHKSETSYPIGIIMLNAEQPEWQIAGELLSLVGITL